MHGFFSEAADFKKRRQAETDYARQFAALHLACGLDLASALKAGPEARLKIVRQLERIVERERLKGMRRHWSYDLNRHIALKQALDLMRRADSASAAVFSPFQTKSGA